MIDESSVPTCVTDADIETGPQWWRIWCWYKVEFVVKIMGSSRWSAVGAVPATDPTHAQDSGSGVSTTRADAKGCDSCSRPLPPS